MRQWAYGVVILILSGTIVFFLVVFPVAAPFLVTNMRSREPDRQGTVPESVDLPVEAVQFLADDHVQLKGWWSASGQTRPQVIIFVHGLNRSRFEMLDRAAEAYRRGYRTLLFDLRNHGESENAHTTLGIDESRDVCAAIAFATERDPAVKIALWGVSLGASTSLLAADRCGGVDAVISDSSFLSIRETVSHHFNLIFGIPSFPAANLMLLVTGWRLGVDLDQGDVLGAVERLDGTPVLFIAGSADQRMPPELAARLYEASPHPKSRLLIVRDASHGRAFEQDPTTYLKAVFSFLSSTL